MWLYSLVCIRPGRKPRRPLFSERGSCLTSNETVSKNIVLNVFKYFKVEAVKFPPNYPQRSYVKKTTEATGLSQRTISWICQSPKSSTASSSASALNSQSVSTPPELPASSVHRSRDPSARQAITKCIPESLLWMPSTSI